jgi:predicted transcriptional regulator
VAVAPTSLDVREIRQGLGLSRERFARLLDVSARTVERWEEHDELPSRAGVRQRLLTLREIEEMGRLVYEPAALRRFLASPMPAFGGQSALQLVAAGQSGRVLGALASLYEGQGS